MKVRISLPVAFPSIFLIAAVVILGLMIEGWLHDPAPAHGAGWAQPHHRHSMISE